MVLVSPAVAGPRPSNASEDSVFTSAERRCGSKLGASVASTALEIDKARSERASRFTGVTCGENGLNHRACDNERAAIAPVSIWIEIISKSPRDISCRMELHHRMTVRRLPTIRPGSTFDFPRRVD